ncbi:Uncharacterised protein [Vibrio cholerae]|nr:Uncharacterised protein [Vibrio cholerae]
MSGRQKTALSHSGFGLIIQTLNMRNADFSFQVFKHVNHGWVRLRAGVNHLGIAEKGVVAASNHLCCYRNRLIAYAYKAFDAACKCCFIFIGELMEQSPAT